MSLPETIAPWDLPRSAPRHTLRMHRLALEVRLGCGAAERGVPQRVELDAVLHFLRPLEACWSDSLADTVCYAGLAEIARRLSSEREFHLLEHLGQQIYAAFRASIPDDARLTVTVRKVAPPVPGLTDGVSFTIEEEAP